MNKLERNLLCGPVGNVGPQEDSLRERGRGKTSICLINNDPQLVRTRQLKGLALDSCARILAKVV